MRSIRPAAVVALAALLVAGACTQSPSGSSGSGAPSSSASSAAGATINVMSLWGGSEQDSFQKVLDAFKTKTGVTAKYESVRADYATTLQTRISGGNPPDVAIIPGIGFLRQFARQGSLKKIADLGIDVNGLKSNYPPGILEIGQVDSTQYAIMVKFNSKSTMWFRPDKFKTAGVQPATDWNAYTKLLADLKAKGQTPLGLGAGDSWTLTDWFENVYVRQAGPDKYDQLFSGKLAWTDSSVQAAVDTMKQALKDDYVAGGITAALGRSFTDGIGQVFSANPQAAIYYEGGFVGGIATGQTNTALKVGDTIDWFDFPAINSNKSVTIGGDVIAAFTTKPGVKEFIQYMTTSDAGSVWAGTGAVISPVKTVPSSAYPNDLAKREAAQVAGAPAVRFDGSDLLPSGGGDDMGAALQDALRGKTVDWAKFETSIQAKWKAEK